MLQKYYWSTIRKTVVAFGNIFNNIVIDRRDADNNVVQSVRVPLSYAPRQKFLARIQQMQNSTDRNFEVVVPRMAFEMLGIEYDQSRKLNVLHQNRKFEGSAAALSQYNPVPWNLNMSLYLYAKNQDDALQVVEQILPYFNPDFNLSVKAMPSLGLIHDLQIVLNTVAYDDSYEGDFTEHRSIMWTFDFTMKLNFYGPTTRTGVIKRVDADISTYGSNVNQGSFEYTATIDPRTAGPDDLYTIIETFDEF